MIYMESINNFNIKILSYFNIYMAENKLVGSLILRTIDIEPTATRLSVAGIGINNNYGITDANGCYVLWKNVNIRTCLG